MPRVQVYISDDAVDKINAIIDNRRAGGAKEKEVSFSSVSSMLIELGLRVYEAQMERKDSAFNEVAYKKALLESMLKTQFSVNKILGMACISPHVKNDPKWEWKNMIPNIQVDVQNALQHFFPEMNEDESE